LASGELYLFCGEENFLSNSSNSTILCSIEACCDNGEVEVESIMPISRSSDFTNDFPPLTAAEAKSFTFSVAAMAGANVRVTLPSELSQTAEGLSSTGRKQAVEAVQ